MHELLISGYYHYTISRENLTFFLKHKSLSIIIKLAPSNRTECKEFTKQDIRHNNEARSTTSWCSLIPMNESGDRTKQLTLPQPGTKALPLGRAPLWWRSTSIGVGCPKSQGVNPFSQHFSQPPINYICEFVTLRKKRSIFSWGEYKLLEIEKKQMQMEQNYDITPSQLMWHIFLFSLFKKNIILTYLNTIY